MSSSYFLALYHKANSYSRNLELPPIYKEKQNLQGNLKKSDHILKPKVPSNLYVCND